MEIHARLLNEDDLSSPGEKREGGGREWPERRENDLLLYNYV